MADSGTRGGFAMGPQGIDFGTLAAFILALVVVVDISVLWIWQVPVPDLLRDLAFMTFGHYLGTVRASGGRPSGDSDTGAGSEEAAPDRRPVRVAVGQDRRLQPSGVSASTGRTGGGAV